MNTLVHIAPQLPPAIDGVGDYCAHLWKHWPEPEPDWKFLVTRGAEETRQTWPEVSVREFALDGSSLTSSLENSGADVAVLHYVGYAYQRKGIPVWLPGAIERWKVADPRRRLVTMFHEMYARSSPLRSPFWVGPFARKIIRELVKLSDAWVTNCDRYFHQLIDEFGARAELGRMLPIGSNIPLIAQPRRRVSSSKFRVVLFGLAKTRLWALERHWPLLRAMTEAGMIESITLLGKSNEPDDELLWQRFVNRIGGAAPWRKRFDLSAEEISRELVMHEFGLLANESDVLTKSGVFAALTMHGVIPILSASPRAALPSFTLEAVFANDNSATTITTLLDAMRDSHRLQQTREQLIETVADHLAWPRITQRWSEVLHRVSSARSRATAVNLPILISA
jgi:hypothetical protein